MTPERWRQVKAHCERLLERDSSERTAYLAELCPEDEELRGEVAALMALATSSDGRLKAGIFEQLGPDSLASSSSTSSSSSTGAHESWVPRTVGRYRVLRLIGEGGMGAVYEAEQEQPRRSVALKVIRPGLASPEMLRRFQREWEALGRLQHPGIARVYEAGTAETGLGLQPFIAMELIEGEPLASYVHAHALPARDRMELVAKVCDAIQHAHERGLIHRDLKPANILVESDGHPRVLDFGVARLADDERQATKRTDVGQLVGTLAYMSPEQALGDPQELDARSDVYAIGLILYELLVGRLPFTLSPHLHEAVQTIRHEEPVPLSSIDRAYRGDIDVIVSKALEKDKQRRYSSASVLADDIRRYLAHEPIAARPASATYQLAKFARRHMALVVGTTAVFVALAAGTVVSTWLALSARKAQRLAVIAEARAASERDEATRERNRAAAADAESQRQRDQAVSEQQRADGEAATAKAVSDFLRRDLLAQAGASAQASVTTAPDPDLKVRTALDRAAQRIGTSFAHQPSVEAAIRQTIGEAYLDLGLFPQAHEQLDRALLLRRGAVGDDGAATLEVLSSLAKVLTGEGKFAEAARRHRQVLTVMRRQRGDDDPDVLAAMSSLAAVLQNQGRYAEAEALLWTATRALKRVRGESHPDTIAAMANLGEQYRLQGKYPVAASQYAEALRLEERTLGTDHPDTWRVMNGLALTYNGLGRTADAERLYRAVLDRQRRILGSEHPDTLVTINNLGLFYTGLGRYRDAEPLYEEALATKRRVLGATHPDTLFGLNNLGNLYMEEARYAEAEPLLEEALAGRRRLLGAEHPNTLNVMANISQTYFREAKWEEAERLLIDILAARRRVLGAEHPSTALTMNQLGALYSRVGRYDEANAVLKSSREIWKRVLGPDHGMVWRTNCLLGVVQLRRGEFKEAKTSLADAVDGSRRVLGPSNLDSLRCSTELAVASRDVVSSAEAESLLTETLAAERQLLGERHPDTLAAMTALGELYLRTGWPDRASPLLTHASLDRQQVLGATHPDTLETLALAGWALVNQHRYDEAATLGGSLGRASDTPTARWFRLQGASILGAALAGEGQFAEAEPLLLQSYQAMSAGVPTLSAINRLALDRVADALTVVYQSLGQAQRADEWRARIAGHH